MGYPVRRSWVRIGLASPHMIDKRTGGEVSEAQRLLTKNPYANFRPGLVDGEFGILTANATKRAKFMLGYPKAPLKTHFGFSFGGMLRSYLLPIEHPQHRPLPRSYKLRRAVRVKLERLQLRQRNSAKGKRERAVKLAHSQIGIQESPAYSNRVKYSYWYGFLGSWCLMFVSWCNVSIGIRPWRRGHFYAYCPFLYADALHGRNGAHLISRYEVEAGDTVLHDWPGESPGVADHGEFFDVWHEKYISFYAVGGNTSDGAGDPSNGGGVYRNLRYMSTVQAFVRTV